MTYTQAMLSNGTGVLLARSDETFDPEEPLVLSGALLQAYNMVLAIYSRCSGNVCFSPHSYHAHHVQ